MNRASARWQYFRLAACWLQNQQATASGVAGPLERDWRFPQLFGVALLGPASRWRSSSVDCRTATEPQLAGRCHAFDQRREIAAVDPDDPDATRRLKQTGIERPDLDIAEIHQRPTAASTAICTMRSAVNAGSTATK